MATPKPKSGSPGWMHGCFFHSFSLLWDKSARLLFLSMTWRVLSYPALINPLSLSSVLTWRMDCQWDVAPWTPRPALALVGSYRPTFPTASGGNPSSTAPTLTLTFHPKVLPETPPLPVTCEFIPTSHCSCGTSCDSLQHDIQCFIFVVCLGEWVVGNMCFPWFIYTLIYTQSSQVSLNSSCSTHALLWCCMLILTWREQAFCDLKKSYSLSEFSFKSPSEIMFDWWFD